MNLSFALEGLEVPGTPDLTVPWAASYIPVLCPPWAAGAPAQIFSAHGGPFIQAEFLVGKVVFKMPSLARSFHFQKSVPEVQRTFPGKHIWEAAAECCLKDDTTVIPSKEGKRDRESHNTQQSKRLWRGHRRVSSHQGKETICDPTKSYAVGPPAAAASCAQSKSTLPRTP